MTNPFASPSSGPDLLEPAGATWPNASYGDFSERSLELTASGNLTGAYVETSYNPVEFVVYAGSAPGSFADGMGFRCDSGWVDAATIDCPLPAGNYTFGFYGPEVDGTPGPWSVTWTQPLQMVY